MVVVDTSVIYKWFTDTEEKRDEAIALLINHLKKKELITVPDLLLYEITNAWATKTTLTQEEIEKNLTYLQSYGLKITPVTLSLVLKASKLAKKYRISVYDASYIVLAQEKACTVITADEKLLNKVHLPYLKQL